MINNKSPDNRGYVVGVDLGGTKILTALADLSGVICSEIEIPTMAAGGSQKVIERIVQTIDAVQQQAGVDPKRLLAVAICSPGPDLDTHRGIIHFSNNLDWHHVYLKEILEATLKVPVYVENDANAAALGEHVLGAGQGVSDLVYITISTGIGGGIILNGEIYHGVSDSAGEIGHTTVIPDGPACSCGNNGCLEALASGTAIARVARELIASGQGEAIQRAAGKNQAAVDAKAVALAAENGDQQAKEILNQAAKMLGIGIANIVNIFNPPLIVLGGGVMKSRKIWWSAMEKEFRTRVLCTPGKKARLTPAKLGSRAGVSGVLTLALWKVKTQERGTRS